MAAVAPAAALDPAADGNDKPRDGKGKGKGKGKFKGKWFRWVWKGGGKGGGGGQHAVEASFEVDEKMRFKGQVDFFSKMQGYGFITLETKDVVPGDRLFVHWQSITTEDRFPFLCKDVEVEFNIQKQITKNGEKATLRARDVSLPGGVKVSLQEKMDGEQKEFVGGQSTRYPGTLKFFDPRKGFGYITLETPPEGAPEELLVDRIEINSGGSVPTYLETMKVECGVFKTKSGAFRAYNMTFPGGAPVTKAAIENRVIMAGQKYPGKVQIWSARQGWGFIKPTSPHPLPAEVSAKLAEQAKAAAAKAEAHKKEGEEPKDVNKEELLYFRREDVVKGSQIRTDLEVMFQLYTDDKGAGACDVEPI